MALSRFSENAWTCLVIVVGSCLTLYATLKWMPLVHIDGDYLPLSHDSFYHARRILDAIADPGNYYQFDPRIHAPEGSWLTWPWAYDWMMARLTRLGMWTTGASNPMAVLVTLPPLMAVINIGLVVGISRQLGFPVLLQFIAVLCFALLPLTQSLHGVGVLDHHFIEHTFVLLALYLGLRWFATNLGHRSGILLGVALGCAPAFHNGLFILQIPVLLTLAVVWIRDKPGISKNGAAVFSLALLAATLLLLLPSTPFRNGASSYFIHSWFHLYIACSTALLTLFVAQTRFSLRALLVVAGLGLLLLAGIHTQVKAGLEFVSGGIPELEDINIIEMMSVMKIYSQHGIRALGSIYTYLIFLLPGFFAWHVFRLSKEQHPKEIFFSVMILFGSLLLLSQRRMHYFGSFALYLPLLYAVNTSLRSNPKTRWAIPGLLTIGIAIAYLPAIDRFTNKPLMRRSPEYQLTRSIFPVIEETCRKKPGVVLADHSDGHYITFHSNCSVIANNFILSPQHVEKVRQSEKLLAGSSANVRNNEPWIDYVYVNRMDNILDLGSEQQIREENAGVREELLLHKVDFPEGYSLLAEVLFSTEQAGKRHFFPIARFFRIDHNTNQHKSDPDDNIQR